MIPILWEVWEGPRVDIGMGGYRGDNSEGGKDEKERERARERARTIVHYGVF